MGSIVLSIVIMLITVMAGKGMQNKIREKISAFSGHILIKNYDNNQSQITNVPIGIRQEFYPDFSHWKEVQSIAPYATIGGMLKTDENFEGIILKGVDTAYNWKIFESYLIKGKIPSFRSGKPSDSIVISNELARKLRLDTEKKIIAYFMRPGSDKPLLRKFHVSGIYETDFEDFDQVYVWGDLRHVQKLYGWNDTLTGGFEIVIKDFNRINELTNRINHEIPPTLHAQSIMDINPLMFDWLAMFDFNVLIVIVILIFISALNMTTVLLVLIMERARFVATLKTLGATDRSIARIFLIKAAWLISVGLLAGNIIVLIIYWLQNSYGIIKLNPEIYYVNKAVLSLNWMHLAGLNIVVLLLILILLLLPAQAIGKISPSKVLKFE